MMINKTFIDLMNIIKEITKKEKTPNFIKVIEIDKEIKKSYKNIEKIINGFKEIKPEYILDFVSFMKLADTNNLIDKSFITDGIDILYSSNTEGHEQSAYIETSCPYNDDTIFYYTFTAVINTENIDNRYISSKCFKVKKGIGITGDEIGDYENTELIYSNKESSIIIDQKKNDNITSNTAKEVIKSEIGRTLSNVFTIGTGVVYQTLTDKIFSENKKHT